jgi:hypothetical protein
VKKFRAISLAVILGLTISSVPAVAVPKPTVAEIEAAKKVEAAKKKIADAQAKKLAAANQSLRALTAKANAAAAVYRKAQAELAVAMIEEGRLIDTDGSLVRIEVSRRARPVWIWGAGRYG